MAESKSITVCKADDKYDIFQDGRKIGTAVMYENPYHSRNCYVSLNMDSLDAEISAGLFHKLIKIAGRPLQVMMNSDNIALIKFLTAGGFVCKRKCYEVEGSIEDYIGGSGDIQLKDCRADDPAYMQCCRKLYDGYAETHREINPLTADFEAFCGMLPETAVYAEVDNCVESIAFVSENEIAYVFGTDEYHFGRFARSLISKMLTEHKCIFFESDDCDWAAMMLKSLFVKQDETSFDTYILEQ